MPAIYSLLHLNLSAPQPAGKTCMLSLGRFYGTLKMAQAPKQPLVAIVGATGTGKSDVKITIFLHYCVH
jgi:hypothetical protein